ncbi:methylmalonyl-CoA mutase family protein [Spongiactinospora sp. 9N601]|uniref:methylmalonyl-CoA mutase family protein n=1 Tax=Spongiactinospora sp. 9N601 TaxID=3375149 RepID=UPI0037B2EFFA
MTGTRRRPWGVPADQEFFRLDAGPAVQAAYDRGDLSRRDVYDERIGAPGAFPFTRGIHPDGQRTAPTLVKVYTGLGTPDDTNRRVRKLVDWGAEIVQLAVDLPAQIGYDPDHIMSAGEVGRSGVSIASLRDLECVFDGVPVSRLRRVGMLGNAIGPIALALFLALAERQGCQVDDFVLDLQNDPLKEYVARGTQFLPVEDAVQLAADVVEWSARHAPHFYPLDVCVNHLNAAGAGSTWGTAFALGNATHYIQTLIDRGLPIDAFAPQIQLFLDEREDFFAAIANVRATRRIWAELLRDRFGAVDPKSMALEVTAYGHGRETRKEPLNNIVRITLGSLAYYLAGVQSLYTASYDEVIQTPSDEAVKIAVRMQQIMGLEIGLGLTADPLGGSYYLESLTSELEAGIRERFAAVEAAGGARACIDSGFIREIISDGAVRRQERYEAGVRPMVGVDRLAVADDDSWAVRPTSVMSEAAEERRRTDLAELRRVRDGRRVTGALRDVEAAVRRGDNSVATVLEAVRAYATIGEISDVLREVFGEWVPDQTF